MISLDRMAIEEAGPDPRRRRPGGFSLLPLRFTTGMESERLIPTPAPSPLKTTTTALAVLDRQPE